MTLVPFQAADDIGDRFLSLLSRYDIQPPSGTSLEDELLSLTQLIEVMKNPPPCARAKGSFHSARSGWAP